ncbi:MAG: UTP--glucose-1-phosphate uridylyltransferase [Rhodospirillaceae bacterium]
MSFISSNAGRVRTAVFPVAGRGTRFLPATRAVPKEMLPLVDRPLIDYAVEEARIAGIQRFIFVTAPGKTAIENHYNGGCSGLPDGAISVVHQSEALGLGHAVWCARHLIGDEAFAVLLPDDVIMAPSPCLAQMADSHAQLGGNMVAAMHVPRDRISSYGCLNVVDERRRVAPARGLVEKPKPEDAPSNLAVVGRYILQPSIMEALANVEKGAGGEIQLTDAIAADLAMNPLFGYRFDGERFDCGSKLGFLEATMAFGLAHEDLGPDFQRVLTERVQKKKVLALAA